MEIRRIKKMKKLAIMAILAMFCMAGIVSAEDVHVGGSITAILTPTIDNSNVLNLALNPAASPVVRSFKVSGTANTKVQLSVTSPASILKLTTEPFTALTNQMEIVPSGNILLTQNIDTGHWEQIFTITQIVKYTDAPGAYSGNVGVTISSTA
jgi:hypothetical protein